MIPQDADQYSNPDNTPKGNSSEPRLPGEENENINEGAKQEDQIDKLQPDDEADKAPNKLGSPPSQDIDYGGDD
ncbi:hypothetical protein [Desertivirga xinjiangensis]|uniref:hypothetical protein n=1 Tax=Desertivirga xinjiangensis TaxID=539206 RepID=UPI00210D510A|nr:hypothetical protein [Pedobacter xinjiangensis]